MPNDQEVIVVHRHDRPLGTDHDKSVLDGVGEPELPQGVDSFLRQAIGKFRRSEEDRDAGRSESSRWGSWAMTVDLASG
jgi:hypothetical protein